MVEGVTSSRPSRHPNSGMSSFARHSASSIAFYSRMGAPTRGIALGSPHSSVRIHTSVWEESPPLRRSSADSSKQRLEGFCATTGTFLPPTERSDRGNTSAGHRTRVLQPLLPCSKKGWRPETHSGSAVSEFFPLQMVLMMKSIMSQIQGEDRFVTINLKDAYIHIQVVQRHRKFLRFAFGGKAYQYKVLPFGLALAPRTFMKCMDAALAPLRFQGIHVLNYLDDWLILAHSKELVSRHRDIVLRHIHSLGLRMNAKKSVLFPSQRPCFWGFTWIPFRCRPVWLLPVYPILQHVWSASS